MTARRPRVDGFVDAWTHAELRGDVTLLAQLLHDDFVAVDEGRTVDKETWISRYRSGGLVHHAFFWRTLDARVDSLGAFVVGHLDHSSSYCGRARVRPAHRHLDRYRAQPPLAARGAPHQS